jgi:hypothetical protein
MKNKTGSFKLFVTFFLIMTPLCSCNQRGRLSEFRVLAFHDGEHDQAHISFVKEADKWFSGMAHENGFSYMSTNNWNNLNKDTVSRYDVIIFLDSRPDSAFQREAFRNYMEKGGAWMGFHFAAFALTPSAYPQDWDWYHINFLGSGQYVSNTWRPTSAVLCVENHKHPATRNLPETFNASPNEWYRWEKDLRLNHDIDILVSIDSSSFPLGTGPKLHEIWHNGYYPVVWSNRNYRMIYLNMGHNDIDYENKTNKELSFTFNNDGQNKLILDALFWLGNKKKTNTQK